MSNYLNWSLNPWAAFAHDKARSYLIGAYTRPDPNATAPQTDPSTGLLMSPMVLATTFTLESLAGQSSVKLGDFPTLPQAQAAAQADANA